MISIDNTSILENLTYILDNCSNLLMNSKVTPSELPPYIRVLATVVCVGILVLGTAGNVLVVLVVWRTKELRNSTNLFLINLSVADLLVLLVCVPPVLVELEQPEVWLLGEGMCKAVPYVQLTAAHGSILTILAISFERYYAICQPLKAGYTCTQMRALVIICIIWLVAALLTTPMLLTIKYQLVESLSDENLVPVCLQMVDKFWQKFYYLSNIVVFFGLPFLMLLVVYCHIGRNLMTGRRALASSSEESQVSSRKQVVLMLIAVVVSFFVCLLPFRVFTVYLILASPEDIHGMGMETYYILLYSSRLLLYVNSALNPLLYNAISSKFRNSVIRLLRCSKSRPTRRIIKGNTTTTTSSTITCSIRRDMNVSHSKDLRVTVNSRLDANTGGKVAKPEGV